MPRRSKPARRPLTPFFGAELPALANRAPTTSRLLLRSRTDLDVLAVPDLSSDELLEEERVVDASWEVDEAGGVRAVGTIVSILDEGAARELGPERLAAFAPVRGEPVERTVRDPGGGAVPGLVVAGEVDGAAHRAKAFVAAVPDAGIVIQIVAACRGQYQGSWIPEDDVEALFEATLRRATLGASSEAAAFCVVTPRLSFEADACVVRSDGTVWLAARRGADALLEYHELPVGLFEALEPTSEVFTVDGKGRFRFTAAFARRAALTRQARRVAGLPGKVPIDVWTADGEAGFALVRDGVLHLARVHQAGLEEVSRMIDTLRFDGDRRDLHRLIDRPPLLDVAQLYRPMPPSLLETVRRARREAR